jgi:glycosyltransferase involved in cell wall biosynthesis
LARKILFVISNLDVGGAERHLVQVLPRLAQKGFQLTVYTLSRKGKLAPVLEQVGIKVIEPWCTACLCTLPKFLQKPLLLLSSTLSFCNQVVRFRPAIIHFFLPEAYLFGGLSSLFLGKRIRVMSRRSLNCYQLKRPYLVKIERWLHPRMDAVLGNSQAVVNELHAEGVAMERLGLLYNGIDFTPFENLPSRSTIRKNLGISDGALLMVCVANLIPYKGHADLIRALGGVRSELPKDWMIALVGRDSGIENDLKDLAKSLGVGEHILWLGERSDAIAIYAAADIGVLCSHEEGFSNSVLEGMASNVAMVVTNVGGNAEAILNGECGIVVPARDPSTLGQAILTLALDTDLRRSMATAGKDRVQQNFSLDTCVSRYSSLYHALIHEPERRIQDAIDSAHEGIT